MPTTTLPVLRLLSWWSPPGFFIAEKENRQIRKELFITGEQTMSNETLLTYFSKTYQERTPIEWPCDTKIMDFGTMSPGVNREKK